MDPQPLRISQLGIIMLGAQDIYRSLAFYRDKLGLVVSAQPEGFAFLNAGTITLCLSEPLFKVLGPAPGAVETVFSVASVRMAHQALLTRGVQFTTIPRAVAGNRWAANFNDPDGHHLSIFGPE